MPDEHPDILELVRQGRTIEAVKLAREVLGLDLAQAREFVHGLERDQRIPHQESPDGPDERIDELLRARRKIEAIKVYREAVGCGLKDAKDAVERRAVELGLQSRPSKCFIATAAFGGGEQAEVAALRRFRNRSLRANAWGRAVIRLYEAVSPPLAGVVRRSDRLAAVVRACLRAVSRLVRPRP